MIPRRTFVAAMAGSMVVPWYRLSAGDTRVAQPWHESVVLAVAKVVEAALGGWKAPPL